MPLLNSSSRVSAAVFGAIASTLTLSSAASAATFAGVSSSFEFSNFSQAPFFTDTNADTSTVVISGDGFVLAESNALVVVDLVDASASNKINSFALGLGNNYLGTATSQATVAGNFRLNAGDTLSFDFRGALELVTAIDNPSTESAFALGFLGFSVLGPSDSDELGLLGILDTPGTQDVLDTNLFTLFSAGNSGNIVLNSLNANRRIGGLEEFLDVDFSGRYSRKFAEPTLVSLVETKAGIAEVQQVPTPSLLWGLMTYGGLGIVGKLRKRLGTPG